VVLVVVVGGREGHYFVVVPLAEEPEAAVEAEVELVAVVGVA
jgi:hypothetical protein